MLLCDCFKDEILPHILPSKTEIKEIIEKSTSEVVLKVENENNMKMIKLLKIIGIEEKKVLKYLENESLLLETSLSFIYHNEVLLMKNISEYMIISRDYYNVDLEEIIQSNSISSVDVCSIIYGICDKLMILSEYNMMIYNMKSSNIVCEKLNDVYENMKLCDLFLNTLRKEEDMRIFDICFKSPEELRGYECDEKSMIWSIGCVLYEMINKKLPFNEDKNMNKTLKNILRCKYRLCKSSSDFIKEMVNRTLTKNNQDRLSFKELREEVVKISALLKDEENNLLISKERKAVLFNNDNSVVAIPIIYPSIYYLRNRKWKKIRNSLIKYYNGAENKRILSILLVMFLYKEDTSIKDKLLFKIFQEDDEHQLCCLDEMLFNMTIHWKDKRLIKIDHKCICTTEEGIDYFFSVLKLMSPIKLKFDCSIPPKCQSLFGSYFCVLKKLKELDLSCSLNSDFVESFVESIPYMKLKYIRLDLNPIGPEGFKLLLPYLNLLIDKNKVLNLMGMNLNDESIALLTSEVYKYHNIYRINIKNNIRIHSDRLMELFSIFLSSNIYYDNNESECCIIT